jgi:spore germination cell wall hydrolase CwlJ-like protein
MIAMVNQEPEVIIQEVEVVKEIEVIKEVPIEVEPTYAYNVTSEEREMLARLVYLEANAENLDCQKAIVSTVMNRLENGRWGDSVKDVIYAEKQFSPAHLIGSTTPNNTNYEAVDYVLKNGSTLPSYIMFFRADYHFNWIGYKPYTQIDQTCFGYFHKDAN